MLVLIRHAETVANRDNIKSGWSNTPLTPKGIKQARSVREDMGGYKYDQVFLSDLERCQDTTQYAIGKTHPRDTWTLAEELRERSGGLLEGKTYQEIRKMFSPRKYKLWQRDYFEAPPQGESYRDVEDRVIPFAKEYIFPLVNEGKNIWVCSHQIPMQIIIGYIKGLEEEQIMALPIEHAMPYVLYGDVAM
jgi:2,3-bisphosphoglycerate-dependent phosphoglycerate mutase